MPESTARTDADRRRARGNTGIRIGVAAVVGVIAVGTVAAAAVLPVPDVRVQPASIAVAPAAGEQVVACPGPLARLSDDAGAGATNISTIGGIALAQGTNPLGQQTSTTPIAQPDNKGNEQTSPPVRIAAPSTSGNGRVVLGAAQSEQFRSGELSGYAATACQEASLDSWLVGGATKTGRTSFVYLANPTDVPATVDLTIYAEQGTVTSPGARGILVPPRAQRVLSLAGLAPNVASPVVHVRSSGGSVAAWIQQSIVRGLQAGGVELTGPVVPPSTQHVIPGVQIAATTAIAERLGQPGNEDLQPVLRVFPQGPDATAMAVTAKSESIGVPDKTFNLGATGGIVTDFVLRDLPDGTYTLTVTADHPVVMAARSSFVSGATVDFAWYQSVQPQTAPFVIAAPTGPFARLHVYNPSQKDAVLDIATPQGDTAKVNVPAGTAAGLPLGAQVYSAAPSVPLVVSVGYLGDGLISAIALRPAAAAEGEVVVYPR